MSASWPGSRTATRPDQPLIRDDIGIYATIEPSEHVCPRRALAHRGHFACPGVNVDPQPHDVVTPGEAAAIFGVPAGTVRSWISRRGLKPLGRIGRYNRYDYRELAEIERDMRAAA